MSLTAPASATPRLSVVLNVMGRLELADYGFRSWMLQSANEPYEVVLNLFNDQKPRYEALAEGRSPHCQLQIRVYDKPGFFNISAANNLGAHVARGESILFANSDVVYPSATADLIAGELVGRDIRYAGLTRINLSPEATSALPPVSSFTSAGSMDAPFAAAKPESEWAHQGWLVHRQTFLELGGFDPNVLVAEDRDIRRRAHHYLSRTGAQKTVIIADSIKGYHLFHTSHELFNMFDPVIAILAPREAKMDADPNSQADVVPTRLDSLESLVKDLKDTPAPARLGKYGRRTTFKFVRRIKNAARVLRGQPPQW